MKIFLERIAKILYLPGYIEQRLLDFGSNIEHLDNSYKDLRNKLEKREDRYHTCQASSSKLARMKNELMTQVKSMDRIVQRVAALEKTEKDPNDILKIKWVRENIGKLKQLSGCWEDKAAALEERIEALERKIGEP